MSFPHEVKGEGESGKLCAIYVQKGKVCAAILDLFTCLDDYASQVDRQASHWYKVLEQSHKLP